MAMSERFYDKEAIKKWLYGTAEALNIRIETHRRYSTAPMQLADWALALLPTSGQEVIFDAGCGSGNFLLPLAKKVTRGRAVALDLSRGVMQEAIETAQQEGLPITFLVGDAEELPFADKTFDMVMANHMLYHVPDIPRAIGELYRTLKKDGWFLATTNSQTTMEELDSLHLRALGVSDRRLERPDDRFSLENGERFLRRHFPEVGMHPFPDSLEFTEAEPLLRYYASGPIYRNVDGIYNPELPAEELNHCYETMRQLVEKEIEEKGKFVVSKLSGAFLAQKVER